MHPQTTPTTPKRSGCAVVIGVLLIAVGVLFLAHNVLGVVGLPSLQFISRALSAFGTYWPVIFIVWGVVKVLNRVFRPERSTVSAFEVLILGTILVAGLSVSGLRRAMEELQIHVSLDDVAGIVGPDLLGPAHRFEDVASFELGSATTLVVTNARGRVYVRGTDEEQLSVTFIKRLHDLSEDDARRKASAVELDFEAGPASAHLSVSRETSSSVMTDLEVAVPRTIAVSVENEKGSVELEGLSAPARATTTHGRIDARDLGAGIDASTSHADIRLERIVGNARAENRHAAIHAFGVEGDVNASSANGSVIVERIGGDVVIKTEHAPVEATSIAGALEIDARYGQVSVERAQADVDIRTNNRPVFASDIMGTLKVTGRNSNITIRGVGRDVFVENEYRPVLVSNVSGRTTVNALHSYVDIVEAAGAIVIESSHQDIRVSEFGSGLEIHSSHADLDIKASTLGGAVLLETSYGDVRVHVPDDADATLRASTRDGEIRSDRKDYESTESDTGEPGTSSWEHVLGSGAHDVTVTTSYGDIELEAVPR